MAWFPVFSYHLPHSNLWLAICEFWDTLWKKYNRVLVSCTMAVQSKPGHRYILHVLSLGLCLARWCQHLVCHNSGSSWQAMPVQMIGSSCLNGAKKWGTREWDKLNFQQWLNISAYPKTLIHHLWKPLGQLGGIWWSRYFQNAFQMWNVMEIL